MRYNGDSVTDYTIPAETGKAYTVETRQGVKTFTTYEKAAGYIQRVYRLTRREIEKAGLIKEEKAPQEGRESPKKAAKPGKACNTSPAGIRG